MVSNTQNQGGNLAGSWGTYWNETYATVKTGCSDVVDEACHIMADIPTMNGLVRWSKFAISAMRVAQLSPGWKGVFEKCISTLDAQKEVFYATASFETTPVLFGGEKKADGKKRTWIEICYAIANILYTLGFLQKNLVYSFPLPSVMSMSWWKDRCFPSSVAPSSYCYTPSVNCDFDFPKEVFVIIASAIQAYGFGDDILNDLSKLGKDLLCGTHEWKTVDKTTLLKKTLKLINQIGKIVLIVSYRHLVATRQFHILSVISLISDGSNVLGWVLDCHQLRKTAKEKFFENAEKASPGRRSLPPSVSTSAL